MKKNFGLYKCDICGNLHMLIDDARVPVMCCGQPMTAQVENTVDAALEKHVPVVTKTDNGYMVKVGGVPHPMTEEHYIEMIELLVDGRRYSRWPLPDDAPEFEFNVPHGDVVSAREYCNLHGLWSAKL